MNNLKRILSLGLTGTMLAGMMVAGASAANFSDADEIKHVEAVNTMTALGVLKGTDTGAYNPDGIVTRAEMAKIITVMLNGGEEPNIGTKVVPTYTDIDGHWAESYIEYCSNIGVIAGQGDGTFAPNATVTGSQAAKMFLVALGYDSDVYGFTGIDWELNTNRVATSKDARLYDELKAIDPSAGLSRDNTAQMAFNALNAKIMEKEIDKVVSSGEISYTFKPGHEFFTEYFNGVVAYADVTGTEYDADKEEYTYSLDNVKVDGESVNLGSLKSETDYSDLFMQNVKILYKADKKNTVYGMYAEGAVVAEGTVGDFADLKGDKTATTVKIDGTKYTLEDKVDKVEYFHFNNDTAEGSAYAMITSATAFEKFAAIDKDGNGKIDLFVLYPVYFGEVTFVGKTSVNVKAGNTTITFNYDKDNDTYTNKIAMPGIPADSTFENLEVKKGDFVSIVAAVVDGTNYTAEVLETMEGKVAGKKTGKILVDGEWYTYLGTAPALGDEGTFQILNGYLVAHDTTTSTSKDLLAVVKVADNEDVNGAYEAKVAFTDGTISTVKIDTPDCAGGLFTYELKDGVYNLKAATTTNTGYKTAIANNDGFVASTDKLASGTRIDDEAVVFVLYKAGDGYGAVKVISGADLKKWGSNFGTWTGGFADTVNGFSTAKVLVLGSADTTLPGNDGDTKYGYIVSDPYEGKEDKDLYAYFDLWIGDDVVSVKDKIDSFNGFAAKGAMVSYKDLGNNVVDATTALSLTEGAVVAYDGTYVKIQKDSTTAEELKITDDTVIVYVNTDDKSGVEGGEIALADVVDETTSLKTYNTNIFYSFKTNDDVKEATVLFVEVNNNAGNTIVVNK